MTKAQSIYVNICDDFEDDETGMTFDTPVQVEGTKDNEVKKSVLLAAIPEIESRMPIVKAELILYDTILAFPHMTPEACESTGFKHMSEWRLTIKGMTHELLDQFMTDVDGLAFILGETKVSFISES